MRVKLVEPNILFRDSFLDFVHDVKCTGYESYKLYTRAEIDFEGFVEGLINHSKGIDLPSGWSPCSSYWLVDDFSELVYIFYLNHLFINITTNLL